MNETIYMPVGEVCSSISDTYREKKNMVTLINTSDVLEGRVLNHERVPNSNSHRPNISSVISGYKQPSKSAQSIEITGFIEKSKPSQIIFLYTLLPLTA